MRITLSDGRSFGIRFIGKMLRNGNQVVIELIDDRKISEIAADFEGVETITYTDSRKPNVNDPYEGYTQLIGINKNRALGTVRLTLERSDAE